jgi:hypothetical protein
VVVEDILFGDAAGILGALGVLIGAIVAVSTLIAMEPGRSTRWSAVSNLGRER